MLLPALGIDERYLLDDLGGVVWCGVGWCGVVKPVHGHPGFCAGHLQPIITRRG